MDIRKDPSPMESPKYYLNTQTGDILLTWYEINIPREKEWVEISATCYSVLTEIVL